MNCLFCSIVAGKIPAHRLYEDDDTLAFLDINPGSKGHALVIPKSHATDIFDITADQMAAVARTSHKVARVLRDTLQCEGVNLFQSSGAAAFQSVFHLHVHVIPRSHGDDLRLPWKPKDTDHAAFAALADTLRAAF